MKLYEKYLLDEAEQLVLDAHKELAEDTGGGLLVYKNEDKTLLENPYGKQYNIIDGIYQTICKLFHIENIEYCCGGGYINFDTILGIIDNVQTCTCSPKLSREKLLILKSNELAEVIIDLFLDRDNWSKDIKYSTILSDGNGNWLS